MSCALALFIFHSPKEASLELATFFSIFGLVFIGEFGDKTQFATGTGALANRSRTWIIYLGSIFALVTASSFTTFTAGLIPMSWLYWISLIGGCLLTGYGIYLFKQSDVGADEGEEIAERHSWSFSFHSFGLSYSQKLATRVKS